MKKFLIGVLIVGGMIAAVAVIMRRRSSSGVDDWDSLAEDSSPVQAGWRARRSAWRTAEFARSGWMGSTC